MKECPFCGKENVELEDFCKNCESYIGSRLPGGPAPIASEKARALIQERTSAKHRKRRSHKTHEYVFLNDGRLVSKSTASRLEKKEDEAATTILALLVVILLLLLLSGFPP